MTSLHAERQLSGKELSKLAARMSETDDAVEAATIRDTIVRGFLRRTAVIDSVDRGMHQPNLDRRGADRSQR